MDAIRKRLKRLRHKLARNALGITLSERRIKHFHSRAVHAHNQAEYYEKHKQPTRARRAHHRAQHAQLRAEYWRRRLKRLTEAHRTLQTLLDKNLRRKHRWLKNHHDKPATGGFKTLDGRQLPIWIYDICVKARNAGAWHGYVVSGYRTPEYSESLCYAICGAPSCPGRCAGRSTNHSCPPTYKGVPYEGAIDATDAGSLRAYAQSHGVPLNNHLPSDYPHSSANGY